MNDLMRLHSMKLNEEGHEAWEWFVLYFDDDPNSLPLYLNTQHQVRETATTLMHWGIACEIHPVLCL